VFKLSPPKQNGGQWTEQVLHSFAGIANGQQSGDGANPNGALVLDSKGVIYGTTYIGGYNCPHNSGQGCGTAFKLTRQHTKGGAWSETVLHRFQQNDSDGGNPSAGLVFGMGGKVYGTTLNGGPGLYGTVFCLSRKARSWVETVLYGFDDGVDGAGPEAGLTFDSHGNVYGTTAIATNRSSQGNVFRMKPPIRNGKPWTFGVAYIFMGSPDGAYPAAALTLGKRGSLFSTTQEGGTGQTCQGGCGTVFRVAP
jgi:hypothetical protein